MNRFQIDDFRFGNTSQGVHKIGYRAILKKKDNTTDYQGNFDITRLDFNIGEETLTLNGMVHVQVSAIVEF